MKRMTALLSLALVLSACNDNSDTNVKRENSVMPVKVTVLALNDFHGNLEPTAFNAIQVPRQDDPTKTTGLLTGGVEVIGGYLGQEKAKTPIRSLWAGAT